MNAPDGPADDGALRLMCARCRWDALCGARAVQIKTSGGFSMHDDAAASGKRQAASGKRQAASGKRQAASGKRQAASGKRQAASRKPQAASRKQASGKQASRQAGKQAPKGVAIRRLQSRTRRTGTRVPRAFLAPSGDVGGGA
ncbi:hypothetical protein L0Z26_03115 [Burkholderia multivorans]|uniref:hypothetical protein n=1 Tax=Burkholderia multivorans TaxID=87883 RepID=UPI002019AE40|nr:hypothetical protein [Burkholderia multivorans]MCO1340927.1 hypothetical protein [Burkholderia multivorans]MCO1439897.1 hypothetical protein [Burkholderia multivorans]UQO31307.1 hypothetical protein L0Z21_27720 [Burkholderia multivorans]UQO44435.1 hypothetical protein L0Z43_27465 [Burkholderia multivorans]